MNTNNLATLGNRTGGTLLTEANEQWRNRPADQRYETLTALRDAMPALLSYVNASAKPAEDAITKAKSMRLIDLVNIPGQTVTSETGRLGDEWQKAFAAKYDFRRAQVRDAVQFARAEEGRCESLWDLINGFTASARSIEYADARIELEARAGKLMALAR